MLGYIKVFKPELKVKEFEVYRGIYCTLCRNLGRRYSPFAQLFLNYDFTLLALLALSLKKDSCRFEKCRCPYNIAKKCFRCTNKDIFDKCSDSLIITLFYKLQDNFHDKGLKNKLISLICFPLIYFAHKKAARSSPEAETVISNAMKEQFNAEDNSEIIIDKAAHPTANALSALFSLFAGEESRDCVERFGYMTGRLIYLLDAADDIEDDIKLGNFNPFKVYYENSNILSFKESVKQIINSTSAELYDSFCQIKTYRYASIFENILTYGLKTSVNKIFSKYESKDKTVIGEEKQ